MGNINLIDVSELNANNLRMSKNKRILFIPYVIVTIASIVAMHKVTIYTYTTVYIYSR